MIALVIIFLFFQMGSQTANAENPSASLPESRLLVTYIVFFSESGTVQDRESAARRWKGKWQRMWRPIRKLDFM